MKVIIFDENGIVYGTGNDKTEAFDDMKQWVDREMSDDLTIDCIEPNYNNSSQAPAGKWVYDNCTDELYELITGVNGAGGDCGFEINSDGIADISKQ